MGCFSGTNGWLKFLGSLLCPPLAVVVQKDGQDDSMMFLALDSEAAHLTRQMWGSAS